MTPILLPHATEHIHSYAKRLATKACELNCAVLGEFDGTQLKIRPGKTGQYVVDLYHALVEILRSRNDRSTFT